MPASVPVRGVVAPPGARALSTPASAREPAGKDRSPPRFGAPPLPEQVVPSSSGRKPFAVSAKGRAHPHSHLWATGGNWPGVFSGQVRLWSGGGWRGWGAIPRPHGGSDTLLLGSRPPAVVRAGRLPPPS